MLNPNGIAWVGLHAERFDALVDFYATVVGFRIIERDDTCCIFEAGGGALFEIWAKGKAALPRKTPAEQSMLVGFAVASLELAVAELRARGLEPETEIDSYLGTRWIHYTDPEGNRFELKDRNA